MKKKLFTETHTHKKKLVEIKKKCLKNCLNETFFGFFGVLSLHVFAFLVKLDVLVELDFLDVLDVLVVLVVLVALELVDDDDLGPHAGRLGLGPGGLDVDVGPRLGLARAAESPDRAAQEPDGSPDCPADEDKRLPDTALAAGSAATATTGFDSVDDTQQDPPNGGGGDDADEEGHPERPALLGDDVVLAVKVLLVVVEGEVEVAVVDELGPVVSLLDPPMNVVCRVCIAERCAICHVGLVLGIAAKPRVCPLLGILEPRLDELVALLDGDRRLGVPHDDEVGDDEAFL